MKVLTSKVVDGGLDVPAGTLHEGETVTSFYASRCTCRPTPQSTLFSAGRPAAPQSFEALGGRGEFSEVEMKKLPMGEDLTRRAEELGVDTSSARRVAAQQLAAADTALARWHHW